MIALNCALSYERILLGYYDRIEWKLQTLLFTRIYAKIDLEK